MRRPTAANSDVPDPLEVAAGDPSRMPEVTIGFCGSNGDAILVAGDVGAGNKLVNLRSTPQFNERNIDTVALVNGPRSECRQYQLVDARCADPSATKRTAGRRKIPEEGRYRTEDLTVKSARKDERR